MFRTGRNIWRAVRARRATVLVDAAAYYSALRAALRQARKSIVIVGWDIDSRTTLCGAAGCVDDTLPLTFGDFLKALVKEKPDLSIKLLLWDYSVVYALEREPLPIVYLRWRTPRQIELCVDDFIPFGASHHQKIVVIDDLLAFSGGLDLTIRRWDTPEHGCENPHRVDPAGVPYPPFHDVQIMFDGAAAQAMGDLVRERWSAATGEGLRIPKIDGAIWPQDVPVHFRDVRLGISRTRPPYEGLTEVREVETLFHDMIAAAERSIYIETQFLTVSAIADSLIAALRANPALEVLVVAPRTAHTWLEQHTMITGRCKFMRRIARAGMAGRVRLLHPHVVQDGKGTDVMVHSKIMIIDDRFLRVGSANLCNRSMGTDTECDITVAAETPEARDAVAATRNRFLAEHTGLSCEDIGRRLAAGDSLLSIAADGARGRALRVIHDHVQPNEGTDAIESVADPPEPIAALGTQKLRVAAGYRAALLKAVAACLCLAALVVLWRVPAVRENLTAEKIGIFLNAYRSQPFAPLLTIGAFVVLGLVGFPVLVLVAATAAIFGTGLGALLAATGALASAAAGYVVGRLLGAARLRRFAGRRIKRLRRFVREQGVGAVMTLRLLPAAPFTIINLVAGAMKMRFPDYLIGTVLGLLPGLILLSVAGDRASSFIFDPGPRDAAIVAGAVVVWIVFSVGVQMRIGRARRRP